MADNQSAFAFFKNGGFLAMFTIISIVTIIASVIAGSFNDAFSTILLVWVFIGAAKLFIWFCDKIAEAFKPRGS